MTDALDYVDDVADQEPDDREQAREQVVTELTELEEKVDELEAWVKKHNG